MLKNERIFISGGNGVIGSCLVRKLNAMGATILVGDLKPRPPQWPREIGYWQGDLNFITKEELFDFSPTYFFHLAATFERSMESYSFWQENFHHNIRLSNSLMSSMKDSVNLKKVIFASSYLIYDPALYQFKYPPSSPYSLKESDSIYPRNLTGAAKLVHEIELRFINHFKSNQYKSVSARIFRGYGCNSRDLISRWVRDLIDKKDLKVYRKEGIFDYTYSDDTAEGLIKLALCQDAEGIVNLGTGRSRKVNDVIDILKLHFPDMNYVEDDIQEDIPYEASQADITVLEQLTGWTPKFSLEKGIEEIIDFERKRGGIYNFQESPSLRILVTSISKKVPLLKSVKNALNKLGSNNRLYGGDIDREALGQYFVDQFWIMPKLELTSIRIVIDYCLQNGIKLIIPTRDGELAFWAKNKEIFARSGIQIMVSDLRSIENCLDKLVLFEHLESAGIPAIYTSLNIDEIKSEFLVVKERFGAGSIGIGLNLSKKAAMELASKLEHAIFQPFIEGKEYSVDLYVTMEGIVKGVIARSRDLVVAGESQITTVVSNLQLEALCARIAESLNIRGHAVLQIIEDKHNQFHVIECNARFGGASTLSLAAGLDSFYWFFLEILEVPLLNYPFRKSKTNPRQIRYASDKLLYD